MGSRELSARLALLVLVAAVTSTHQGSPADSRGAPGPGSPPHCRTFFSYGDTEARDGADYSTLLLWREHANLDAATATWTLAVNVTATEGARVMLGSAVRPLPGQPHYELVLGTTTTSCRMITQHHKHDVSKHGDPLQLFEDGALQLWIRWRVEETNITTRNSSLEVTVLPAGRTEPTRLFTYLTNKPIQIETFSFGSSHPGDVAFTVCSSTQRRNDSAWAWSAPALGVPGCRSLFTHVRDSHQHVHNLAADWSETVDDQGRLQFWARAATDVEVIVTERLRPRQNDPKYHVIYGGEFNTKSWVLGEHRSGAERVAGTATPALLSATRFTPLWLAVSPVTGLTAGSGDLSSNQSHILISWTHPRGPTPKFISFATYRQRLVHILIDCRGSSPTSSLPLPPSSCPADLLDSVQTYLAAPRSAPPALKLHSQTLSLENDTLTATGQLLQEWQYPRLDGRWNPSWFDVLQKMQFWLLNTSRNEEYDGYFGPELLSQDSFIKVRAGPLQVSESNISWNNHATFKMPCEDKEEEGIVSCCIKVQQTSRSQNCHIQKSEALDHGWKAKWETGKDNNTDFCIISLNITIERKSVQLSSLIMLSNYTKQHKNSKEWFIWINISLTLATLCTLVVSCMHFTTCIQLPRCFSVYLVMKNGKFTLSYGQKEEADDEAYIVGYNGKTAEITESLHHEQAKNNHLSIQSSKYDSEKKFRLLTLSHITFALILANLFFLLLDLTSKIKRDNQ